MVWYGDIVFVTMRAWSDMVTLCLWPWCEWAWAGPDMVTLCLWPWCEWAWAGPDMVTLCLWPWCEWAWAGPDMVTLCLWPWCEWAWAGPDMVTLCLWPWCEWVWAGPDMVTLCLWPWCEWAWAGPDMVTLCLWPWGHGLIWWHCVCDQFWPSCGQKNMTENGSKLWFLKMVVSDHYLKKYLRNPIQTWCLHLLGECSELICFLATVAKFWPSSGQKRTENGGFRPLSEKVFMQSNSILVFTLIGWVFRIQFKLGVYTYWVSVQKWFAFWPCWPKFGPLLATKWLKFGVSDHYLEKYSHNRIQTWCLHLLGECSEMICFLTVLAEFWPSSGHKMTENGGFRPLSGKVFMQSNSNLMCVLIGWVFRNDLFFGHVGHLLLLTPRVS